MLAQDVEGTRNVSPLWWRIPAWLAITAVSVLQTHGVPLRVATAVLLGGGALALQFARHPDIRIRRLVLLASVGGGLGACFTAPGGLAEVLVAVATSRAPESLAGRWLVGFVVVDTVAFGATVGFISHSVPGLMAGLAVPLLVQRAVEHQDLVRERDRAQALLAEAQRARESEAQTAALRERGRIAREMHDVLAHSLAGLSMQLQGLRAVAAREQVSPAVLEPLDKAAALAREGLTEARAAVGTLRDPVGLGLDALGALVDRHPGQTRLQTSGDITHVSAETGHAVYRAVQEALTNAARYAPGSPVSINVRAHAARLVVTVDDSGPGPGRNPVTGQGTGLGLAGMAERVRGVGGSLHAGPRDGGGWRILVDVPVARATPSAVTA